MCVYNAAPYLRSSLASIVAQFRAPDEVIVFDDGSTDETATIAEGWSDRLPIRVIRGAANAGVGTARRAAIEASTGTLVAILDADDYWFPDHLEVLCDTYRQFGGIVTATNYRWVAGSRVGDRPSSTLIPIPPPDRQASAILIGNFVFAGALFAREMYDRVGGVRADVKAEDWDLWIRMIRAGARVTAAPTVTVLYRQHTGSVSSGESLPRGDVALLESLAASTMGRDRRQVLRALRRQRARVLMLDGYQHIRAGRAKQGRAMMARAVLTDRSLRRGDSHWGGSVSLRALACLIAPRRAVAVRDARTTDPDVRVGVGADRPWLGSWPRSKMQS
jgi:cellulose synthase/poly-beta-1,6-N-acetylglucosamine synthase-like glycosyltransferase